jgi:hypothetical protein
MESTASLGPATINNCLKESLFNVGLSLFYGVDELHGDYAIFVMWWLRFLFFPR